MSSTWWIDDDNPPTLVKGLGPGDTSHTTTNMTEKQTPNRYNRLPDESAYLDEYMYDSYAGTYVLRSRLCKGEKHHKFVNIGFRFDKFVCSECNKEQAEGDLG